MYLCHTLFIMPIEPSVVKRRTLGQGGEGGDLEGEGGGGGGGGAKASGGGRRKRGGGSGLCILLLSVTLLIAGEYENMRVGSHERI